MLSALRFAQEQNNGFLTPELMDAVAEYLKLPPIQVYEVASFYSMFETHPCGRHHVSVCTNIACMLNGADEIVAYIEKKLGIKTGESTPDGRIFLKREEECLAACTGAPMMMVDHHLPRTPDAGVDRRRAGQPEVGLRNAWASGTTSRTWCASSL